MWPVWPKHAAREFLRQRFSGQNIAILGPNLPDPPIRRFTEPLSCCEADLACARAEWLPAVNLASDAIAEARGHGRPKYVVAGLETRARALAALGRTAEAVADLRPAVQLARDMGDEALFLRAALGLLAEDGSDALLAEARQTGRQILAELPTQDMRRRFQAAEPIQRLALQSAHIG